MSAFFPDFRAAKPQESIGVEKWWVTAAAMRRWDIPDVPSIGEMASCRILAR